METNVKEEPVDWITQLQPESRQNIVNMVEASNRQLKISEPEELVNLYELAVKAEENVYDTAESQSDYLLKISMKAVESASTSRRRVSSVSLPTKAVGSGQSHPSKDVEDDPGPALKKSKHSARTEGDPQTDPAPFSCHPNTYYTEPVSLELVLSEVRSLQSSVDQLQSLMSTVLSELHQIQRQQKQMSQHQSQPTQMQQQLGMTQRLQTSDSKPQTGQNAFGWQEEVYQKIKAMKEAYLPDLSELHQKISLKFQQHESHPQQPKSEQYEKYKILQGILDKLMVLLNMPKNNIVPGMKEKMGSYERYIQNIICWKNSPRNNFKSVRTV